MARETTAGGGHDRPSNSTKAQLNPVDRYFGVSARGSTVGTEIRGGLATFFTMAYIVVLNPLILIGGGVDRTGQDITGSLIGGAPDPGAAIVMAAAATALVAGVLTILMGAVGRYPFALAAGLGLNAFVATLAADMTWADAMGLVVIEGVIIAVLVLTGFRTAVFNAIPAALKTSISVGIGLFIALIGFVDAGFVRSTGTAVPPIGLGIGGSLRGWPLLVFGIGLVLTAVLVALRVKGSILIGIVVTTIVAIIVETVAEVGPAVTPGQPPNAVGWQLNTPALPDQILATPDLGLLGDFSVLGSWDRVGVIAVVLLVFSLMLSDFFDTMGTVVGVGGQAGLLDQQGNLPGVRQVLFVDSVAAAAGGAASVSSNTTYIESAAGVGEGARTGLASVVTGVLFLIAMVFAPLVTVVPYEAATPALVIVGFLMMTQVRAIDWDDYGIAIPAFLTIVVMPFTYSIANGIGAGFIAYAIIRATQGRAREVHWLMWISGALFLVYFAIEPIRDLLGVS